LTDEDAAKVAKIMLTADGWCSACVGNLLDQLKRAFPDNLAAISDIEARQDEIEKAFRAADLESIAPVDIWDQRLSA
jgi:hypothetical protein